MITERTRLLKKMILVGIIAISCQPDQPRDENIPGLLTIDGIPVYEDEFHFFLSGERAVTFAYFAKKYQATHSSDFWSRNFAGEIPLKKAKASALKKIIRFKVEQQIMYNYGILESLNYHYILEQWEAENARRKKALGSGRIIYGPEQYTFRQYFLHLRSNKIIDLKKSLAKDRLAPSSEALHQLYEQVKEERYQLGQSKQILFVRLLYPPDSPENQKKAHALGLEIKELLQRNDITEIRKKLEAEAFKDENIKSHMRTYALGDSHSERHLPGWLQDILPALESLKTNEVTHIIPIHGSYCLARCQATKENGYVPFQEAQVDLSKLYIDWKYQEWIARLVKEAEVKFNEQAYKNVSMHEEVLEN